MELYANDRKLRAVLDDEAKLRRLYGADMAKKLGMRIQALRAAESLEDFWPPNSGPERCHALRGNLAGIFSMDVEQPYRLLLSPEEVTEPADPSDERSRWRSIKAVKLLRIEDTHG